ncbi:FadR/GntR family transcriptional regulator [Paracoccus sp. (in: a-proteobacteria)]|uniref:FadR/GntR family transcriptional regulator n=1 Tax=Paracoccus sp. TaxID=267 RepID=UPI002AFE1566|nr:FCD domain-containing protein [Paracoccus sp. (in: a-proteobacteria)]
MANFSMSLPKSKAEYVAQLLLDRIITTDMQPGSSFGTEAELLEQYDVSRPTLRESLRILEAQGVLQLRPGPKGGILVTKPGMDILAHGLSVYLRLHDVPFIEVLKAREVIEPALAAAAAENATDEDLAALQASVDRMGRISDQAGFVEENRVFHSRVAEASKNEVMAIFWSTISILAAGEQYGIKYTSRNQRHVVAAHQGIVDAIRARDSQKSAALMGEHLGELENLLGKRYQNLVGQATHIVGRTGVQVR